jgi:hypothetical protein
VTKSRPAVVGIVLGLVLLAVVACFAIFLPKARASIALPDTLPGGWTAMDLASAYSGASSVSASDIPQYQKAFSDEMTYQDATIPKVTGVDSSTRGYGNADLSHTVVVQVFDTDGGVLAPYDLTDPGDVNSGSQVEQLTKQGNATCVEYGSTGTDGTLTETYSECLLSGAGREVHVTGDLDVSDLAAFAQTVLDKVS